MGLNGFCITVSQMFNLRFSREMALKEISVEGYEILRKSKVSVVGLGATGSPVADLFVRAGIGKIQIIDGDTVDISNIHRQILYSEGDVSRKKVEAAAGRLHDINRDCEIQAVPEFLTPENTSRTLGRPSVVIDGTDNMETRRIINSYCVSNSIPWVFISSIGTVSQVKAIIPGKTSCLDCFIDRNAKYSMSCEDTGVLASAPLMASSLAWTMALKILLGNEVDGGLWHIDPWHLSMEQVHINRNPGCPTCGKI